MVARHLITTSDERTWKFDRPVIFLGEWCLIYDRKHVWEKMDAIVAEPYGLGQAQKDKDFAQSMSLRKRLFPDFCSILNHYHGTKHNERFWQIITGFWFSRFVDVILNRYKTLENCLNKYQISGTTIFDNNHYSLVTTDSIKAVWSFEDDRWNNALNTRLLEFFNLNNFLIETVSDSDIVGFYGKTLHQENPTKRRLLIKTWELATHVSSKFVRRNDAFIVASFLSRKKEIKLQIALGQFPQLWRRVELKIASSSSDRVLRKTLAQQMAKDTDDKLEVITRSMLFEMLPVCYLEGYNELNEWIARQPWPKNPKFIYTCNNFDRDEVFTLWTANKIEKGVKYVTGQHGNNYGTSRYMNPSVEEATSDRFLTWGWTDNLPQHTPAFILRIEGKDRPGYNRKGGLLLIEVCFGHRFTTWDVSSEFADYFKDQQEFVTALSHDARKHLTIRLHREFRNFPWNELARWKSFDSFLKIDIGGKGITKLIKQSRLVVFSYDSTGLFENLALNIPSIAFWQYGFDHLRDNAKPYYQLLVDAGIVHLSAESAAQKINEIWDDVEGWWARTTVQDTRKLFCEQYARVSYNLVPDLKKKLLDS